MTIFQRIFGARPTAHTYEDFIMNTGQIPPSGWLAHEISQIREGVTSIRTDVSALAQDIKNLGSTQNRHETWLTKIEGDVMSLRGFPQKIENVETNMRRFEVDFDSTLKRMEVKGERQDNRISELESFRTSELSKNQGLMKFITVTSILVGMGATVLAGLFWLFSKLGA